MSGRLRIASGLVLFTYVVLHLSNHALLLVSMRFAVAFDAVALLIVIVALVSRGWLRQLDTSRIEP